VGEVVALVVGLAEVDVVTGVVAVAVVVIPGEVVVAGAEQPLIIRPDIKIKDKTINRYFTIWKSFLLAEFMQFFLNMLFRFVRLSPPLVKEQVSS
jgi:hypothetical protein